MFKKLIFASAFLTLSTFASAQTGATTTTPTTKPAAKKPATAAKTTAAKPAAAKEAAPGAEPEAIFDTSMGKLKCTLFPKQAPKTVENFIGLANGTKEWTNPATGKK